MAHAFLAASAIGIVSVGIYLANRGVCDVVSAVKTGSLKQYFCQGDRADKMKCG